MEEWNKQMEGSPLVIESIYNEEYELWEVSMDGQLLANYLEEEEAAELAANVHIAFEHGYVNGIQTALAHPAEAQKALLMRGLTS